MYLHGQAPGGCVPVLRDRLQLGGALPGPGRPPLGVLPPGGGPQGPGPGYGPSLDEPALPMEYHEESPPPGGPPDAPGAPPQYANPDHVLSPPMPWPAPPSILIGGRPDRTPPTRRFWPPAAGPFLAVAEPSQCVPGCASVFFAGRRGEELRKLRCAVGVGTRLCRLLQAEPR